MTPLGTLESAGQTGRRVAGCLSLAGTGAKGRKRWEGMRKSRKGRSSRVGSRDSGWPMASGQSLTRWESPLRMTKTQTRLARGSTKQGRRRKKKK